MLGRPYEMVYYTKVNKIYFCMNAKTKVQKISAQGQITLPAAWRRAIKTNHISVSISDDRLEIRPARFQDPHEYTVFDAIRDNNGKGLAPEEILSVLKNIKETGDE
jgi:bifunctional DNA-binding transcriptional regulator/antitoxin component of YhaV-PrlF toxin-antitoxin module